MGPLFVLVLWAVAAAVISMVAGPVFAATTAFLLRGVKAGKARAIWTAALLPAAGFVYLFFCVVVFSIWSVTRGRDMGWGDAWDTPLLGSYHLVMIDVTDQASLCERVQSSGGYEERDIEQGVRRLEVRPPYLLGTASPDKFTEYPIRSPETLFFIFDTRSGTERDEPSLAALQKAAEGLGGPLKLEPVDKIYGHFRYSAIDLIPATLLIMPLIFSLLWLMRELRRLRATRETHSAV